jgi:Ca2+-binding RTX toxin-like protein
MRFPLALLIACVLALPALPAGAAADTTPTCAEGPTTVGDTTYGTPCPDLIVAPAAVEDVKGGGGNDTIVPAALAAVSSCPSGCHLGVGSQTFEGGDGDDVVFGERGNDTLLGGAGNDQLFGGIGDDLLQGGPGNDRLAGGFGADSIDGEEGDDYVRGDSTIDRIFDTGGGTDTLSFSTGITPSFGGTVPFAGFPEPGRERGVRFQLGTTGQNANNGTAPDGGGVDEVEVGAFETIVGTAFSDYIVGTAAAETIYGGGGADAIVGGGGADTLVGGADGDVCESSGGTTSSCGSAISTRDDSKVSVGFMTPPGATPYAQLYLVGSEAADSVTAAYSPAAVTFQLAAGSFDQSAADAGGCEVKSSVQAVCPLTAPLDSLIVAGMGAADTLAAPGFPLTTGIVEIGGVGGDSLTGGDTEDILVDGTEGAADTLEGLGGDDALTHNNAADQLLGGDGNDLFLSNSICDDEEIVGGAGRDNSSWARFGEGVGANLATGAAGRPGSSEAPVCGAEPFDSLAEIEDLEGSSFDDSFYGDAGPNQLLGHPGADSYFARAGSDSILANSGDADVVIDCGADSDSAVIDHPEYGDPQPVGCESLAEADPNNFRTVTQLPPPPPDEEPPGGEEPPAGEETPPAGEPPAEGEAPPSREPSPGGSPPAGQATPAGTSQPQPPAPVLPTGSSPAGDSTPPQTRLLGHPPARLFAPAGWRRIAFRFTSSEGGSRFRCRLDRQPFRACASPRVYRIEGGRHRFRVFAIDRAGNADPTPALFRFRLGSP